MFDRRVFSAVRVQLEWSEIVCKQLIMFKQSSDIRHWCKKSLLNLSIVLWNVVECEIE